MFVRCTFYRLLRVRVSRSDKPVSGKRTVAETDLAHLPSGLYARLHYGYTRGGQERRANGHSAGRKQADFNDR